MSALTDSLWQQDLFCVIVMFALGLWCIFSQRNMIKILIGVEIMARAATLCLISAGFVLEKGAVAQAIAIMVITIDAAVVAVALALVVNAKRHFGAVNTGRLTRLRG